MGDNIFSNVRTAGELYLIIRGNYLNLDRLFHLHLYIVGLIKEQGLSGKKIRQKKARER
jgi:hypothetical protein